ncbi:NADP-dependent oxidoreductase [Nocardioides sp. NPDC101246]|uniref:NADP-dependent oxidoreductase n=1 Tax=Nocardioides sp. NPDC101246 TaxID=3364336 RepID=UPI003828E76C
MTSRQTRILLAARPDGAPRLEDFEVTSAPIPEPGAGEVLVRTLYLSLDPYLRGRMGSSASHSSSTPPVALGAVMEGGAVAEVVRSEDPHFGPGDVVSAATGWQEYGVVAATAVRRVDPDEAPVSTALGIRGMPGLTAYGAIREIGRPQRGETVVVAAATGAVGSLAGQMARLAGARVVGIAGGERKAAWLREAGFDVALDHRDPAFETRLAEATPDGIDVYVENVGGRVWQAVWPRLNRHARVPVCGVAAAYSTTSTRVDTDVAGLMSGLVTRSITLRGFVFSDFEHLRPTFEREVADWLRSGAVSHHEDIVDGLANAPAAFLGMLAGEHLGKRLVRVSAGSGS